METKQRLLKVVADNINLKGIVIDLMNEVVDDALNKVVEGTETEFDNVAKNALYPVLEKEIIKLANEKLDLTEIFKLNEPVVTTEEA